MSKFIFYLIVTTFSVFISRNACAQTYQEKMVCDFGDYMSSWCSSGDDSYREKIDQLVQGDIGCRVDNGIMKIFVQNDKTGLLTNGTALIDSYLNRLANAIEDDLVFKHGQPVWQQDYKEPVAYTDKTESPLYFVSMDVNVQGSLNYSGCDLFFVRGGQITKIVDFNDNNSFARAIQLYSAHKYDEAFQLFRKLAYSVPENYVVQYPFDKSGHALVVKNGKIGYINKQGEEVISVKYTTGVTQFSNVKTYGRLDETLLLINEKEDVIKTLGKGYDGIDSVFVGGKAFVHHKDSKLYYLHDLEENITSVEKESFSIDYKNNCYFTKKCQWQKIV